MKTSSYERALAKYPTLDRTKIDARVKEWHGEPYPLSGERIANNIYREHFLHEDMMKEILLFIENNTSLPWDAFESAYQKLCYSFALQGEDIEVPQPSKFFGAAVEADAFASHLMKQLTKNKRIIFKNKKEASDFIASLKRGNISRLRKRLPLKNYGIWTTWNLSDPNGIPFEFCNTKIANEVRANMGLDKRIIGKELILFVYEIPSTISIRKPTIADAELYPYFLSPIPPKVEHGWTEPWRPEKSMIRNGYNVAPRPEGVHSSITLSCLKLPIETRC